ncbi:MAG TPA: carboxymuconolactone decarboxylase family protein [Planctomycetota bacterium]|nr:carboxymuconolactone decarboxylase family protein [Planctomycetota bacterium]
MADSFFQKSSLKQLRRLKAGSPNAAESFGAMSTFFSKAVSDGVLPAKTKELIAIAVAHATHCAYCIDHHVKAAAKAGATEAEINEAILVAIALTAGASFTHAGIALDSLDEAKAEAPK